MNEPPLVLLPHAAPAVYRGGTETQTQRFHGPLDTCWPRDPSKLLNFAECVFSSTKDKIMPPPTALQDYFKGEIHLFNKCSFNKYVLSAYCVPATILSSRSTVVGKIVKHPCPPGRSVLVDQTKELPQKLC